MATPAYKGNTKAFPDLTFDEQARSITAMINNSSDASEHHSQHAPDPVAAKKKCVKQVHRFLGRLLENQFPLK
jgi:hypothetical protein